MPRVLLLLPTNTYKSRDFLDAAKRIGLDVTVASEEPSTMQTLQPVALLTLDLQDGAAAADRARDFAARHRIDVVLGVDEPTVHAASWIAKELGLPHNSTDATLAAKDKSLMRQRLADAGLPVPRFGVHDLGASTDFVDDLEYPCVLKPLTLSASRGVIRANDPTSARKAIARIRAILADTQTDHADPAAPRILAEQFIAGSEFALDGLLTRGELRVLALFDKPDPLDGPFFAETIYVTPSRLPADRQAHIADTVGRAARALGLEHGPIHAEVRLGEECYVIEIAGRSIGGLCARSLRFGTGMSLEEVVLRHALGREIPSLERERPASGVYMIPVPHAGALRAVHGTHRAQSLPGVDVTITAHIGQRVLPLPEGNRYLGFVFARAETPADVEAMLREGFAMLEFEITP